jgi:hypothetical protein
MLGVKKSNSDVPHYIVFSSFFLSLWVYNFPLYLIALCGRILIFATVDFLVGLYAATHFRNLIYTSKVPITYLEQDGLSV